SGYEIHHGRTARGPQAESWIRLDDPYGGADEGARAAEDPCLLGTNLHGIFEDDGFRAKFLGWVAQQRGKEFSGPGVSFVQARAAQFDRLADALESSVEFGRLEAIIAEAAHPVVVRTVTA